MRQLAGAVSAVLVLALGAGAACRTDSSGLALREPSSAGSGGESTGGSGALPATPVGSAGTGGTANLGGEGPGSLTLLHGIVDGGRLLSCWSDAASGEVLGGEELLPAGGLEFGRRVTLPLDWDVATRSVRVELFTSPRAAESMSCAELRASQVEPALDAAAPAADAETAGASDVVLPSPPDRPRRAGELMLAAGALRSSGHYLLAAAGCATRSRALDARACGSFDVPSQGHSSLALVELRRIDAAEPGRFGLQFLNASRGSAPLELLLLPRGPGLPAIPLASEVGFGVVRPRSGAVVEVPSGLELRVGGAASAALSTSLADVLAASEIESIELGRSYFAVYVGPALDAAGELALSAPALALPALLLVPRGAASE